MQQVPLDSRTVSYNVVCISCAKMLADNTISFLPEASFGLRVLSLPLSVRPSVTKFVRAITHHPFKLGSPNLDHRCKTPWLRSLLFWGAIDLDLQDQIWLKKSNFLASPLLEIHNHHINTREPWVPSLLHRPDCFMVSILCMYLYTLTVSRSWLFHSLNTLHVHWSRQPRVFRRLTPFLFYNTDWCSSTFMTNTNKFYGKYQ